MLLVGACLVASSCTGQQKPAITDEKPVLGDKPPIEEPTPTTPSPEPKVMGPAAGGPVAVEPGPEEGKAGKIKHRQSRSHTHTASHARGRHGSEQASASGLTIYETLKREGSLNTMRSAVDKAGLARMLRGKGPYTLIVPSDRAPGAAQLKAKSSRRLQSEVYGHILKGKYKSADLKGMKVVQTWNGERLRVSSAKGRVTIGQAAVVRDIVCANGVIQVVDAEVVSRTASPAAPSPKKEAIHEKKSKGEAKKKS